MLMTADTVGGVWTYALELSRALATRGVSVTLATMGSPLSEAQWAEARAVPGLSVEQSTWQLEWMDDPWEDVKAAGDWLLELEARVQPDVVHLNGYCHGALPWKRKPLMVGHSCVLSWWEAVKGEQAPERYSRYRWEVARGLRAAGHVVAPTAAMLQALVTHYGPLRSAGVISNARRPEDFPPGNVREPLILAAGRLWDEAKNVSALEAVAPRLDWPVLVAGDTRAPLRRRGALALRAHAGQTVAERTGQTHGPRLRLRPARALRALRPVRPGGRARRVRAGAGGHPLPARGLGGRGRLRSTR